MDKQFFVYMTTNYSETSIYTGITNNLARRLYEHKSISNNCYTHKYKVNKLVYYEIFDNPIDAITREKQIKGWTRIKKKN
ncbi:MAG: GIY-YIG nuclease family protein [Candidatus Gastranaerophilales bacterium]|nr:GIY-YIG nuclease family protein [Candidatus Gastranaerophilales bacterium]